MILSSVPGRGPVDYKPRISCVLARTRGVISSRTRPSELGPIVYVKAVEASKEISVEELDMVGKQITHVLFSSSDAQGGTVGHDPIR